MNRGKRSLDFDGEDDQPERNRPALVSAIVDALKVDILQKLCSTMEPVLRRVVSEEVERSLANLGPNRINGRSSPRRIKASGGRNLQLQFKSRLSLPLFTGGKVEGEQGAAIHVVLVDASTGQLVTSGPESSAKLDVVVLEGDFNNEDDEGWSLEEFESHVVKEREGKRPLLIGDLQVTLKEGVGTLGSLTFTDNSSWIRTRKFRLGLMVASGISDGTRVREAKTEAFSVKDHRGELYKKNYPPALDDEVWRLEKIGKDGPVHQRLKSAGIYTVEDFLRVAVRDAKKLRSILGSGMSDRMWDTLMEHAKTCVLSGKLYVYYPDHTRNIGAAFNDIYEFSGLISGDQYAPADSLSDGQKVFVDTLVKKAYDNWDQVIEYDGPSIFKSKQTRMATRSSTNELMAPAGFSNSVDHNLARRSFPVPGPSDQPMMQSALPVMGAGINDGLGKSVPSIFSNHFQVFSSNPRNLYDNTTTLTPHELVGNMEQNLIARNLSAQISNLNNYDDWSQNCDIGINENLTEEAIRQGSHAILENEDMQQLLQPFNTGDIASMNVSEEGFKYPSFMPFPSSDFSFGDDPGCSGKAVIGWVKIKAAMRWGFFIRKKAAERRRAQLVELEG